jgi:chemotaxis protein methyltransferase CheR
VAENAARQKQTLAQGEEARGRVAGPRLFDLHPKTITDKEFALFQDLIYRSAGIWLSHNKTALLVGRLSKRLRVLGLKTFAEYHRIVSDDRAELTTMLDAISTNETRFFREPAQFEFLEKRILPQLRADADSGQRMRLLRVWSAGCSTGQEPYSLAMTLLHHLPPSSGWSIDITATDLSTRVLEIAESATWDLSKAAEIPEHYLKSFMLRGFGEKKGRIKAGPEIRSLIRFSRLNLNDEKYPFSGKFDLIFCRNLLIYFDAHSRARVIHRLFQHLSSRGFLFVGHAESLHCMNQVLRCVVPTIYSPVAHAAPNHDATD